MPTVRTSPVLRVAIDVTPTLGRRSGIGHLVAELLDAVDRLDRLDRVDRLDRPDRPDGGRRPIELVPFAVTFRGRRSASTRQRGPMPARPLRAIWKHADFPTVEWWTGRVDVVHGTNFVVPPARHGVELVSVHDLTPVRFPELCTPDTLEYPVLIRRAVARGAHVHTDSQFVADEVCDWLRLDAVRVHVVRPGIPGRDIAVPPNMADHPRLDPMAGPRYILALGTVEPRKNIALLVRSFARIASTFPDVQLMIAGADAWGGPEVDAAVEAVPPAVRSRITRLGYVDDARRESLLREAAIFAYPSRYEGFGFPPLEAMRAGVPVVSTSAGSLPEVLGDAAQMVDPDDEDAFTGALHQVLGDQAHAQALRARGIVRAQMYSWSSCASAMTALYRVLAERELMHVTMIAEQLRRNAPGGIGTYVRGLAHGLRMLKEPPVTEPIVELTFLTSPPQVRPDPLGAYAPVRAVPLPAKLLTAIWERDRLRGPASGDIVHATSFAFPAPRRRKPIPLTVFVHDLAWRRVPEAYPERGIQWHERGLARAIEHAQVLLVPSELTKADLVAAGADVNRIRVVPEGCDHLPRTHAEGLGKYLLAVSTIEPRKNIGRLIEAYARIRPSLPEAWPLRIVGPSGWDGHGADGLPAVLPEGVELVGAVSDSDLASQYAGARAFAYVPLTEGFGLPPLEAMRVGLAVACSPVPSVVEPLVRTVASKAAATPAVIVDPLDVDSIASGLFRVLADDTTRGDVRRGASAWVAGRSWRVAAAAHRDIWDTLTTPGGP